MKREEINSGQAFWLVVGIIIPTIILLVPRILIHQARQIGWISILISGFIVGLLQYILLKLSFKYSHQNVVADCKSIFGPILGRIIIAPYILVIIAINLYLFYESTSFIGIVMPNAPILGFWVAIGIIASYLAYSGIETLVRVNEVGMLFLVISVFFILIVNIKGAFAGLDHLKPVFIKYKPLVRASIVPAHWFILVPNIFLVLKPFFKNVDKTIKASLLGNLFSQFLVLILVIFSITLLGFKLINYLVFPFYTLSRLSIQGLEIVVFVAWIAGGMVKIGIYYFSSVNLIAEWFDLKDYKKIIVPFSIIIIALTILGNAISLTTATIEYIVIGFLFTVEIPTLFFLICTYYLS